MVFLILTNETNNNMKKEIGLVLSGGGTKGIAEAGALKFLEEKIFFLKSLQERVLVQL